MTNLIASAPTLDRITKIAQDYFFNPAIFTQQQDQKTYKIISPTKGELSFIIKKKGRRSRMEIGERNDQIQNNY